MDTAIVSQPPNILPKDGDVRLFPELFSKEESDFYLEQLLNETPWVHEPIVIFGRQVMQPRLTAWVDDRDSEFSYSGTTMKALPWTPTLAAIKERVETIANVSFTSALLNQYRNERDSVGWHRDNESILGRNPVIASVSFGEMRQFHLRHYYDKTLKQAVDLSHGSLLLMQGATQHNWEHCLPKRARPLGRRINVTLRVLKAK